MHMNISPDAERLCCRIRSAVAFARAPVLHLLCLHLWCANRSAKNIVSHFWVVAYIKNERY